MFDIDFNILKLKVYTSTNFPKGRAMNRADLNNQFPEFLAVRHWGPVRLRLGRTRAKPVHPHSGRGWGGGFFVSGSWDVPKYLNSAIVDPTAAHGTR